jgi:hypothetical protein
VRVLEQSAVVVTADCSGQSSVVRTCFIGPSPGLPHPHAHVAASVAPPTHIQRPPTSLQNQFPSSRRNMEAVLPDGGNLKAVGQPRTRGCPRQRQAAAPACLTRAVPAVLALQRTRQRSTNAVNVGAVKAVPSTTFGTLQTPNPIRATALSTGRHADSCCTASVYVSLHYSSVVLHTPEPLSVHCTWRGKMLVTLCMPYASISCCFHL